MNHLDEGTIHAWLDGAVDATRVREIEAHVAQCSSCSATVAEARGLIAGSSRILNALDDVPAGVTPKRAVAPKRQWRASRWVTSIAAALVLAIGITTWNRGAVQDQLGPSMTANPVLDRVQVPAVQPPPLASATQPAAETTMKASISADNARKPEASQAPARRDADVVKQSRVTPKLAKTRVAKQPLADVGRAAGAVSDSSRADAFAAAAAPLPPAPAPSASPPPAETRLRRLGDRQVQLSEVVVTGASAKRAGALNQAAPMSEMDRLAGCYRVPRPSGAGAVMREAASAAANVAAEAKRTSSRAAPAPARAPVAADFAPQPPALLRLDTLRRPLGFAVRSATSDSTIGWWNRVGSDSVQVDLLAAGVFSFATKDRVNCPITNPER